MSSAATTTVSVGYNNLRHALLLSAAGLNVFPVNPDSTRKPYVKWRADSTTDASTVTAWWDRWPCALVALDLAKAGLVTLDVDRHRPDADGVQAFADLVREHGTDLSANPVTQTPRNGYHVYFHQPESERLGNRPGDLPAGIDVCAYGITTPGNVLPDGRCYRAVANQPDLVTSYASNTIPPVPSWLVNMVRPKATEVVTTTAVTYQRGRRFQKYAAKALDRMARQLAGMAPGRRNKMLNDSAWKMGTMAARGWIERAEVERALFRAAVSCGLCTRDPDSAAAAAVRATIKSGFDKGLTHPHPDLRDREPGVGRDLGSNRRRA